MEEYEMESNNEMRKKQGNIKVRKIIYYILGVLEVLFAFRLVFKILGANSQSAFVNMIYSVTNAFLTPFSGIFKTAVSKGLETQSILEPQLIIAMIVYALIAWGIVRLIEISSNHKDTETLEAYKLWHGEDSSFGYYLLFRLNYF
jgi:hypothetical protein